MNQIDNDDLYYISVKPWGVYVVMGGYYFESRGGLIEVWGDHWFSIQASSPAHAKKIGFKFQKDFYKK